MSSAGAARTRSRRSSQLPLSDWSLGLTCRGRVRPLVTRPRDLRPQGHPLPRGHAEAFQPSVHNCSRHVLGQPSQRLSFLSCTATYQHYDPSDTRHEDSCARLYWTNSGLQANIVEEYVSLGALYHVALAPKRSQEHIVELLHAMGKIFVHLPVPMISTGTDFSMQGCIGQNSVSKRASSRKIELGNIWRDFAHVHDHQTASLSVSCARVFGRTYPVPMRTLLKITCH